MVRILLFIISKKKLSSNMSAQKAKPLQNCKNDRSVNAAFRVISTSVLMKLCMTWAFLIAQAFQISIAYMLFCIDGTSCTKSLRLTIFSLFAGHTI